jgi:large subunit ribosomal protein L10e
VTRVSPGQAGRERERERERCTRPPLTHVPSPDRATALEALRRSQYKFPGRQKIIVSKNWGFTPLRREEYLEKKQAGRVKEDGAYVQFLTNHGSLARNIKRFPDAFKA